MAQNISLFLLRLSVGWLFFYAGITKILDPQWSAEGYIRGAKLFPEFFNVFLSPGMLPITNLLNEWGLALIGAALMLGVFVRWAALAGIVLMALYYLPLGLPYPNPHSYIVDEHVIYIFSLATLAAFNAGRVWGLGKRLG